MTEQLAAMKQALNALKDERDKYYKYGDEDAAPEYVYEAIAALRTAIEAETAQGQEPVAWVDLENWLTGTAWPDDVFSENQLNGWTPLYTTPPAAPVQEPSVWVRPNGINNSGVAHYGPTCPPGWVGAATAYFKAPAAQPALKPLTDEQIWLEYQRFWPFHPADEPTLAKDIAKFARAIEKAHGITGETK